MAVKHAPGGGGWFPRLMGGSSPPSPDQHILQEDGSFILQEDLSRINLEPGTPQRAALLTEAGGVLLQENGFAILLEESP